MNKSKISSSQSSSAFTLIEILLAVALLSILAGIVILAINPSKQLAQTRNSQRRIDARTIVDAVNQYQLDNNAIPAGIDGTLRVLGTSTSGCDISCTVILPSGATTLATGASVCLDLGAILAPKYVVGIPKDPSQSDGSNTHYAVQTTNGNRIAVYACGAELGETINASR